ncbi:MAG TPA: hypothetical protein DCY50_08420 [Franconibacter helveticus]|uniref:hypothetical protein n=1 Tax=Franconibacter helveticus TaxID=357240 RepID=UPI00041B908C|nr:hypothetical protein [Franconibacter helveticus]MDU6923910.1 hypothetical protein [Franconibacter helveticus]HAZ55009.1 hypothetical protein [Franconibacter helveticus]
MPLSGFSFLLLAITDFIFTAARSAAFTSIRASLPLSEEKREGGEPVARKRFQTKSILNNK